MKKQIITTIAILLMGSNLLAIDYRVDDFGAIGDGIAMDTEAVQKAIDECTANGGGKVILTSGKTYRIGTIYLKSYVTLYLENGSVLQGSNNIDDYATDTHKQMYRGEYQMDRCLIFARDAHNFAIDGYGIIDGNGDKKTFISKKNDNNGRKMRPMLLRFVSCSKIHLNNVRLINPVSWTSAWLYCDDISVSGISIISRVNGNGDGLDFDGCTNVRVSNCNFDNSDDCICLQTSRPDKPCKDIVITNCIFKTKWGGIRIGLLSRANIESVTVSNCVFKDIQDSGLKIQQNEGGEMPQYGFFKSGYEKCSQTHIYDLL